MNNLSSRTALVTGSTSGIGFAIASSLARAGIRVLINGAVGDEEGRSLTQALRKESDTPVAFHAADVSDPDAVTAMFAYAGTELGPIDILVNNAGVQHVAPVEDFPREQWARVIGINLSGVFWASQQALPHMRKQGWGRIVNIASAHGLVASANKSAYVAAKHGVLGLTKTIALETAGSGVTCNAICPGWVRTPLAEAQVQQRASQDGVDVGEAARRLIEPRQPSGTFIAPDDIASMVHYLVSEAAAQVTGAAMQIDGGWTAQ